MVSRRGAPVVLRLIVVVDDRTQKLRFTALPHQTSGSANGDLRFAVYGFTWHTLNPCSCDLTDLLVVLSTPLSRRLMLTYSRNEPLILSGAPPEHQGVASRPLLWASPTRRACALNLEI